MTKINLGKIKEFYIQERSQIISSLSSKDIDEELDIDGDEVDMIQGKALHQLSASLSSRDLRRLTQIENVLGLFETDSSSINECEDCGEEIGEKRLIAIPGVRICIKCAEEAESSSHFYV